MTPVRRARSGTEAVWHGGWDGESEMAQSSNLRGMAIPMFDYG